MGKTLPLARGAGGSFLDGAGDAGWIPDGRVCANQEEKVKNIPSRGISGRRTKRCKMEPGSTGREGQASCGVSGLLLCSCRLRCGAEPVREAALCL